MSFHSSAQAVEVDKRSAVTLSLHPTRQLVEHLKIGAQVVCAELASSRQASRVNDHHLESSQRKIRVQASKCKQAVWCMEGWTDEIARKYEVTARKAYIL